MTLPYSTHTQRLAKSWPSRGRGGHLIFGQRRARVTVRRTLSIASDVTSARAPLNATMCAHMVRRTLTVACCRRFAQLHAPLTARTPGCAHTVATGCRRAGFEEPLRTCCDLLARLSTNLVLPLGCAVAREAEAEAWEYSMRAGGTRFARRLTLSGRSTDWACRATACARAATRCAILPGGAREGACFARAYRTWRVLVSVWAAVVAKIVACAAILTSSARRRQSSGDSCGAACARQHRAATLLSLTSSAPSVVACLACGRSACNSVTTGKAPSRARCT